MKFSDQTIIIIKYCIITVFILVYLPLLIYYGIKYYLHKNHVALKQRYASITIIELILTCILSVIMAIELLYFSDELYVIWAVCATLLFSCWVWRYWLITFDIKWNILMSNEQWMSVINPSLSNKIKSTFIVRNKNTLGNIRWISYHILIPWNILWFIYIIIIVIKYNKNITIIILLAFEEWIPWILLFGIYCNLPEIGRA
eukprot:217022_1